MNKNVSRVFNGLKDEIVIPSDKSISHRAVMFSSLSEGKTVIKNFSKGTAKTTLELFKQHRK